MARGGSSRTAGGTPADVPNASPAAHRPASPAPVAAPPAQFPVPLDRSALARFEPLLADYRDMIQNITTAIDHTSDVAVALTEVGDEEELEFLDKTVKECIAECAALKDAEKFLKDLKSQLSRTGKLENLVDLVEENERKFQEAWNAKSEAQKYNTTDEYIDFRSKLWDVNHGDTPMAPLPTGDEDDEDLIVGTQKVSLTCPLTTKLFEDPLTSTVCNHSFSKTAILAYIRQHSGLVACPIPGCDKYLEEASMQADARLAAKVRRHRQRKEDAELEKDEEYTMVE